MYPNLERRLLHGADLLLANTESMQREYERLLGAIGTQMTLLPNGFDETDFVGPVELPLRERPQFLYCGRFSNVAGRTPDLILQGLRTLIDDGRRAELRIVGDTAKALRRRIAHYGLEEYVDLNPSVPHGQAVRELRHADVLVLYQEPSFTAITPVAGKTFEYVRSGRPILAILPPGDNHDIVRRYAPTSTLLTSRRPEDLAEAMRRLHDHWHAGRLRSSVTPDREFRQHFDRRELTRKLARLFNELVAGRDVDDTGASSH